MPRAARHLASLLAAPLLALLLVAPFAAAAQGLDASYRVRDIAVEATAPDAVQAQAIAIEQGQRDGLRQLLERLTAGTGQALPDLSGVAIDDYVQSFEVLSETVGPDSYAASLAVSYDRAAVQDLLDTRGLAYVQEAAPPATLVPLWQTTTGLQLWEADNAWKAAWDTALVEDALAPFVVPLGDLQDLALLDAEQAVRSDAQALRALADRYGTEDVVIARLVGSGEPGAPLEVRAQRFGGSGGAGGGDAYQAAVRQAPGEPLEVSLERAVREMQAAFDERVRQRSIVEPGSLSTVVVTTAVAGLEGWGRLLRYLDDLAEVETATVRSFSREEARMDLEVRGGVEGLREVLARAGWFLEQDAERGWRLQQGGAPVTGSTL